VLFRSQGIFNKLANGLGDFLTGYKDNRENGFDPNNLRPVDNKGFMQRIGVEQDEIDDSYKNFIL